MRNRAQGIASISPVEALKNIFFILFIVNITGLYVVYLQHMQADPTFSHLQKIPTTLIVLLSTTIIFSVVYLVWLLITIFCNICHYFHLPWRAKIMFLLSLIMLGMCLGTLTAGVYSPYYGNGGVFVFFLALFNIYVFTLVYLNWPQQYAELLYLEEQVEMQNMAQNLN